MEINKSKVLAAVTGLITALPGGGGKKKRPFGDGSSMNDKVGHPIEWLKANAKIMAAGTLYITGGFQGGSGDSTITEYDINNERDLEDLTGSLAYHVHMYGDKKAGSFIFFQMTGNKVIVAFDPGFVKLEKGKLYDGRPVEGVSFYEAK